MLHGVSKLLQRILNCTGTCMFQHCADSNWEACNLLANKLTVTVVSLVLNFMPCVFFLYKMQVLRTVVLVALSAVLYTAC